MLHINLVLSVAFGLIWFFVEFLTSLGIGENLLVILVYISDTSVYSEWTLPLMILVGTLILIPSWAVGLLWGLLMYIVLKISSYFITESYIKYLPVTVYVILVLALYYGNLLAL